MHPNVNLSAPIGALAFLGVGFLFLGAALVLIHSLVAPKRARAKAVGIIMLGIAGTYLGSMFGFAFTSRETVLARGEEKHFCEIDCHLAYSIANVRQSKTLGDPPNQSTAQGVYTIVTIKTRFDETTISARRGNGLLYPNSRVLTLVDELGNKYAPASVDQRAFNSTQTSGTPLTTPLRPAESYTTDVIFDLPADVKTTTLLITEGEWNTHLLIGHENSPLHKTTKFQL